MKNFLLVSMLMILAAPSFAASILGSSKCYKNRDDFGEPTTYITGHTLCVKGKATKIPTHYDEREMIRVTDRDGNFTDEYQFESVYCFNHNFVGAGCKKYLPGSNKTVRDTLLNSTDAKVKGVTIDGKFYEACSSSAVDADGDSWGWENNKTCKVI